MSEDPKQLEQDYHIQLYNRYPVTLTEGKGSKVWDDEGNEYIDALAGIAVNVLGHSHPNVVKAVSEQAEKLIHVSNFYYTKPLSLLSKSLCEISGMDRVFFCNSGGEAVEGAIKLARKYGHDRGKNGKIISMENCFHGRTLGTISLGKEKYWKGFEPITPGFKQILFNDREILEEEIDNNTIGVILEPIQGEGGIHPASREYLQDARKLCNKHDALLILDEIQTGIGRTGSFYAYQQYDVEPDIVATAKGLGSGLPIGAVLARQNVAEALTPGSHGTTFGGNPLACAASLATLNTIREEQLIEKAAEKGKYIVNQIRNRTDEQGPIKEIRGRGLMIGVELEFKGKPVVKRMLSKGVLSNCTSDTVIRLVPPLTISRKEQDIVIDRLIESIKEIEKEQ